MSRMSKVEDFFSKCVFLFLKNVSLVLVLRAQENLEFPTVMPFPRLGTERGSCVETGKKAILAQSL